MLCPMRPVAPAASCSARELWQQVANVDPLHCRFSMAEKFERIVIRSAAVCRALKEI